MLITDTRWDNTTDCERLTTVAAVSPFRPLAAASRGLGSPSVLIILVWALSKTVDLWEVAPPMASPSNLNGDAVT